jgi:multiple sugar transport system ATP-binding protein
MNFLGGMLESIEAERCQVKLDTGVRVIVSASVDASRGSVGDKVELGIRPEHMVMLDDPMADNRITGTVNVAEHLGAESYVYMDVGGRDFTVRVRPETPATSGRQFEIGVPADACHLFDGEGIAFPRTAHYNRT